MATTEIEFGIRTPNCAVVGVTKDLGEYVKNAASLPSPAYGERIRHSVARLVTTELKREGAITVSTTTTGDWFKFALPVSAAQHS